MYWPTLERTNWDPFSELRTLQREMNRLFNGQTPNSVGSSYPVLNLWSNGETAVVTSEAPGFDPTDLDVTVVKNVLTIQGERKADVVDEDSVCHRRERGSGRFSRTLQLPFEVENDQVAAKYENGVLTITLPRSEATRPKKIEITSA